MIVLSFYALLISLSLICISSLVDLPPTLETPASSREYGAAASRPSLTRACAVQLNRCVTAQVWGSDSLVDISGGRSDAFHR